MTRHLTTAAIRAWRSHVKKTTVIITHDLTSINAKDFVYVMHEGCVAEQGFRADLEKAGGEWNKISRQGGCYGNDESDAHPPVYEEVAEILASQDEEARETQQAKGKHYSLAPTLNSVRPVTMVIGGWMFDVITELTKAANGNVQNQVPPLPTKSPVVLNHASEFEGGASGRPRRPSSMSVLAPLPTVPPRVYDGRTSLQFTATTPSFTSPFTPTAPPQSMVEDDEEFESEKMNLKRSAEQAIGRREKRARRAPDAVRVVVDSQTSQSNSASSATEPFSAPGFIATLRLVYPTIPAKHLLFSGLLACLLNGAMTPVFSFLLSRLMFEVSANPGADTINTYAAFVLGMAAVDGLIMGLKYFLMETSAIRWVTRLRDTAYSQVLSQDKAWFDSPAHSPAALAQVLVEDADDARVFVVVVMGQFVVVVAMMSVGLVWAMVWGWQLTLVGIAIGPVFVGVMAVQAGLVAKCEVRNKRAREEVARVYYEVCPPSDLVVPVTHSFYRHRRSSIFVASAPCPWSQFSNPSSTRPLPPVLPLVLAARSSKDARMASLQLSSTSLKHSCSTSALSSWPMAPTRISRWFKYSTSSSSRSRLAASSWRSLKR